jgi:hypothetical protein
VLERAAGAGVAQVEVVRAAERGRVARAARAALLLLHEHLVPDARDVRARLDQLPVLDRELVELALHLDLLLGRAAQLLLQLLRRRR